MAIRNALILPGELPGYGDYKAVNDRNVLARREMQAQEEQRAYERQRQQQQDARQSVLDGRQDQQWAQGKQSAAQKAQLEKLQTIYAVTSGITDPAQFEAMKPQLRAIIPDIDGETFESVQRLNQIGQQLFGAKPEVRTVGGSLVRVDPDMSVQELYAPPEKPPAAPAGYRFKGDALEYIPGGPADPKTAGTISSARRAPPKPAAPPPAFVPPWKRKYD